MELELLTQPTRRIIKHRNLVSLKIGLDHYQLVLMDDMWGSERYVGE